MGKGTGHRKDREEEGARDYVPAERENPAQVARQRNNNDLADEVGGRDPGAVVDAGADAAFDVEQRSVSDLECLRMAMKAPIMPATTAIQVVTLAFVSGFGGWYLVVTLILDISGVSWR